MPDDTSKAAPAQKPDASGEWKELPKRLKGTPLDTEFWDKLDRLYIPQWSGDLRESILNAAISKTTGESSHSRATIDRLTERPVELFEAMRTAKVNDREFAVDKQGKPTGLPQNSKLTDYLRNISNSSLSFGAPGKNVERYTEEVKENAESLRRAFENIERDYSRGVTSPLTPDTAAMKALAENAKSVMQQIPQVADAINAESADLAARKRIHKVQEDIREPVKNALKPYKDKSGNVKGSVDDAENALTTGPLGDMLKKSFSDYQDKRVETLGLQAAGVSKEDKRYREAESAQDDAYAKYTMTIDSVAREFKMTPDELKRVTNRIGRQYGAEYLDQREEENLKEKPPVQAPVRRSKEMAQRDTSRTTGV